MLRRRAGESLGDYLKDRVFSEIQGAQLAPAPESVRGFQAFLERYKKGLEVERAAVTALHGAEAES